MPDRAVLFIDGNNWYHSLSEAGVADLGRLDYAKVSQKLVGPREWVATLHYIGQVQQKGSPRLYAERRRFLAHLKATDSRISVHLGRLEERRVKNEAALELRQYLSRLSVRIDVGVFHGPMEIATRGAAADAMVMKAVDVMLAVDLVMMAQRDEFDSAYLLSADGDYTLGR